MHGSEIKAFTITNRRELKKKLAGGCAGDSDGQTEEVC